MSTLSGTLSYAGTGDGFHKLIAAPYLVLVATADRPTVPGVRSSIAEVERVEIGRGTELTIRRDHPEAGPTLHLQVADGWMSGKHVLLTKRGHQWHLEDRGSKNGCYVNGERCAERPLQDGDFFFAGNSCFLFRSAVERSALEAADLPAMELRAAPRVRRTLYPPFARSLDELEKLAREPLSLIIEGETGTGKELTARYAHELSGRAGAFVAVNCGALPANLVESELFGHRKGAFSGAHADRVGLVQAAHGGTLFLDELGELPLDTQVKLLRVLQEREVQPVGATRPIPVDIRVVCATHVDLPARVREGAFREDLYARLHGASVCLPPLRERKEDLGLLIASLLQEAQRNSLCFEREALWDLLLYHWPQNIRELEQVIRAATARADEGKIRRRHLPPTLGETSSATDPDAALRQELLAALRQHNGNVSAVARHMGKARVQIRRWCKRFDLDPGAFR